MDQETYFILAQNPKTIAISHGQVRADMDLKLLFFDTPIVSKDKEESLKNLKDFIFYCQESIFECETELNDARKDQASLAKLLDEDNELTSSLKIKKAFLEGQLKDFTLAKVYQVTVFHDKESDTYKKEVEGPL